MDRFATYRLGGGGVSFTSRHNFDMVNTSDDWINFSSFDQGPIHSIPCSTLASLVSPIRVSNLPSADPNLPVVLSPVVAGQPSVRSSRTYSTIPAQGWPAHTQSTSLQDGEFSIIFKALFPCHFALEGGLWRVWRVCGCAAGPVGPVARLQVRQPSVRPPPAITFGFRHGGGVGRQPSEPAGGTFGHPSVSGPPPQANKQGFFFEPILVCCFFHLLLNTRLYNFAPQNI
jgi:hypothetical protein